MKLIIHSSCVRPDERANARNVRISKSFTVVIRPLSTCSRKPNFHVLIFETVFCFCFCFSFFIWRYKFFALPPYTRTPHARTGVDQAHEQTTEVPASSGLNSAGNFSVDTLFNAHLGVRRPPFLGTSWNIFGVPTYTKHEPTSDDSLHTRRTRNRDHRY